MNCIVHGGHKESDMTERLALSLFSHLYHSFGKTVALSIWTFVGKVMSLLFDILSRFVTVFLPRRKSLLISWLQSPSAVTLEPKKIKSDTVPLFPHLFPMK